MLTNADIFCSWLFYSDIKLIGKRDFQVWVIQSYKINSIKCLPTHQGGSRNQSIGIAWLAAHVEPDSLAIFIIACLAVQLCSVMGSYRQPVLAMDSHEQPVRSSWSVPARSGMASQYYVWQWPTRQARPWIASQFQPWLDPASHGQLCSHSNHPPHAGKSVR